MYLAIVINIVIAVLLLLSRIHRQKLFNRMAQAISLLLLAIAYGLIMIKGILLRLYKKILKKRYSTNFNRKRLENSCDFNTIF